VTPSETALVVGVAVCSLVVTWWATERAMRNAEDWCQSRSTAVGSGYDTRPAGLRCRRGAGHRGDHNAVAPDGRLWWWCDE
jgi:hypothetical protein